MVLLLSCGQQTCEAASQIAPESAPRITIEGAPRISAKLLPPQTAEMLKQSTHYRAVKVDMPPSPREFRGVWIATVMNIDWPLSATDHYLKQKDDFIRMLDYYRSLNFNAVIVQIRSAGDAFYPSTYAPWSRYLTGKEGQKPATNEDPLVWMIREAHARGMEFHAWMNPYRATMDAKTRTLSRQHDYFRFPKWMIKYDNRYYYNPGLPEVRAHLVKIVKEVVRNYDIDAIHFDDYFYPFKHKAVFNDTAAFKKYGKKGQSLADWRRANVNMMISEVSSVIKQEKPWVQFGISPFGVWRNIASDPGGSRTRAGLSNYDHLYADVLTWMKNGWIDYLIPQLYWSLDCSRASYRELVGWWSRHSYNTKIYIGNGPYKIRSDDDTAWQDPMEIPNQLRLSRSTPNIYGNAYFSAKSMYHKNTDVATLLRERYYNYPALPPQVLRIPAKPEADGSPVLVRHEQGYAFEFTQALEKDYRFAVIYAAASLEDLKNRSGSAVFQKMHLDESSRKLLPLQKPAAARYVALSFLSRYGDETAPLVFEFSGRQ